MDQEEFQAWKDSPATQWVLLRLARKAAELESMLRERLYQSTTLPADQWANQQAQVACDRGIVTGINFVVALEHEEIDDSKPIQGSGGPIPG